MRTLAELKPFPSSAEQAKATAAFATYFPDLDARQLTRSEWNAALTLIIEAQRSARRAAWGNALGRALRSEQTEEHGYGTDADCLCGRNFDKVRGLREHLTKMRAQSSDLESGS